MILYLDTSALVKLFVDEPGSDLVRRNVGEASSVTTHLIAYAEMRAAFAKILRMGRVGRDALAPVLAAFEQAWTRMDRIGVTEMLVRRAGGLAQRYDLRGYDSVHLAAALSVRDLVGLGVDTRFVAFDKRLSDAAVEQGLALIPYE